MKHLFPQMSFTTDAQIVSGTGAFVDAQGVISYSGRGLNDMSEFIAYVSIIANRGMSAERIRQRPQATGGK